ncbi:MAG: DMT family transporter [Xanthomonadaceae bacterium]|nr:DMT family transporter [Xanthomonadaceae bacterium]
MSLFVKFLAVNYEHEQIVFFRAFVNFILVFGIMLIRGESLNPPGKKLLFFRGFVGFLSLICFFYALIHLPLSISAMLNWCSPVFVFFVSAVALKEHHEKSLYLWVTLTFVGLYFLFDPKLSQTSLLPLAVGIGILGAMFSSLAFVAVRVATKTVGVNGIVLYFTGTATALSLPLLWGHFHNPVSIKDWAMFLAMGLFATGGQIGMTMGYRYSKAGLVSTYSLLGAAFSSLWGYVLLDERLAISQWAGMLLMAIGISFVAWRSVGKPDK